MTKDKLVKELEFLKRDLDKCDRRCKRISKACGVEPNELISYAVQQTQDVLEYIESIKEKENDQG
jgi:hypothetical protein